MTGLSSLGPNSVIISSTGAHQFSDRRPEIMEQYTSSLLIPGETENEKFIMHYNREIYDTYWYGDDYKINKPLNQFGQRWYMDQSPVSIYSPLYVIPGNILFTKFNLTGVPLCIKDNDVNYLRTCKKTDKKDNKNLIIIFLVFIIVCLLINIIL